MEAVFANPKRLYQSAFHAKNDENCAPSKASKEMLPRLRHFSHAEIRHCEKNKALSFFDK